MMKSYQFILILLPLLLLIITMFFFNFKNHPIIMMIMLIIYSMLISLNMSIWNKNFMYSIMMFLIMISGLLIIFLYFSSLISNNQLNLNFINPMFMLTILMNLIFLIFLLLHHNYYFNNHFIYNFSESSNLIFINELNYKNISIMYNFPFNMITILCMMYLLITLFTMIKMCSLNSKPLRKIN